MEKHEKRDQVSLLSEFYEEGCSTSSTPPPELESQDDRPRTHWARTALCHVQKFLLQVLAVLLSAVVSLVPSFIPTYRSSTKDKVSVSDRRISPTAYLDGLRGIACFVVYLVHFVVNWWPNLKNTYGASPKDHYFFQLPIIRVIFEGQSAVATFFVISGYAISYRALSKIHTGDIAGVLETLSSSTFRRCMRLQLPCAVNTFICMLLRYWDLFTPDPLRWNTLPPQRGTFPAQFWDWWANQKIFMYPFLNVERDIYSPPYNGHLWTIPLEIRGSFVVYGTVLAVAKLNPFWRMTFLVVWDCYLYYMGKWDLFLFVGGAVLANLDIPRHAKAKKGDQHTMPEGEDLLPTSKAMEMMTVDTRNRKTNWAKLKLTRWVKPYSIRIRKVLNPVLRILRVIIPSALFILSLYLLSFPHIPFGVTWAYYLVPSSFKHLTTSLFGGKDQGVRIIGSILLAFSLSLSASPQPGTTSISTFHPNLQLIPPHRQRLLARFRGLSLQSLFTNAFSQYLGRISFGFYLMHGPVLFCIGTKFLVPAWKAFEAEHSLGEYVGRFVLAVLVNTVAIFWAADVFARVVDERSVRWAAWLARFVCRKKEKGKGDGAGSGSGS